MSECYFGAEACEHGHMPDCPGARDVWGEETKPRATPMPAADGNPSRCPTRIRGVQCVYTPGHGGECRAPMKLE